MGKIYVIAMVVSIFALGTVFGLSLVPPVEVIEVEKIVGVEDLPTMLCRHYHNGEVDCKEYTDEFDIDGEKYYKVRGESSLVSSTYNHKYYILKVEK